MTSTPGWHWSFAGERELLDEGPVWDTLLRCDVVVCAPTTVTIAAVAAAQVPAILVLPDRATAEQRFLAEAARRTAPVVVLDRTPAADQWRTLLLGARGLDGRRWGRWAPGEGLVALRGLLGASPVRPRTEELAPAARPPAQPARSLQVVRPS